MPGLPSTVAPVGGSAGRRGVRGRGSVTAPHHELESSDFAGAASSTSTAIEAVDAAAEALMKMGIGETLLERKKSGDVEASKPRRRDVPSGSEEGIAAV